MLNLTRNRDRAAFTLIELLVVVIIVAVLASVGVPLLSANVTRAKGSEAEAGLGTIRTSLRTKKAEIGTYPTYSGKKLSDTGSGSLTVAQELGLATDDLDGRYFLTSSYTIASSGGATYCAQADGSTAPLATGADSGSQTIKRAINQDGKICQSLCPCS